MAIIFNFRQKISFFSILISTTIRYSSCFQSFTTTSLVKNYFKNLIATINNLAYKSTEHLISQNKLESRAQSTLQKDRAKNQN